jgi:hypothetical protein
MKRLTIKSVIHDDTPDICLAAHGRQGELPHDTGSGNPPCRCRHVLETITVNTNGLVFSTYEEINTRDLDTDCEICEGVGSLICRACSGTGATGMEYTNTNRCYNCDGRGEVPCEECCK